MSSDSVDSKPDDIRTLGISNGMPSVITTMFFVTFIAWALIHLGNFLVNFFEGKKTSQSKTGKQGDGVLYDSKKKQNANGSKIGKGASFPKGTGQLEKVNPPQTPVEGTEEKESLQGPPQPKKQEHDDLTKGPATPNLDEPKHPKNMNVEKEKKKEKDEKSKNIQIDELQIIIDDLALKLTSKMKSKEISNSETSILHMVNADKKIRDECLARVFTVGKSLNYVDNDLLYDYITTITGEDLVFFRNIVSQKSSVLFLEWYYFFDVIDAYIKPMIKSKISSGNGGMKSNLVTEQSVDVIIMKPVLNQIHRLRHLDKSKVYGGHHFYDNPDAVTLCETVARNLFVQPSKMGFKKPADIRIYFEIIKARYGTFRLYLFLEYHKQRLGLW